MCACVFLSIIHRLTVFQIKFHYMWSEVEANIFSVTDLEIIVCHSSILFSFKYRGILVTRIFLCSDRSKRRGKWIHTFTKELVWTRQNVCHTSQHQSSSAQNVEKNGYSWIKCQTILNLVVIHSKKISAYYALNILRRIPYLKVTIIHKWLLSTNLVPLTHT